MAMDIHELRSFLVLSEQLHFGRAAKLLHLSQPALTKQIRRLEEGLRGQLFERSKHGTRLSAFGQEVLDPARTTVRSFDQLVEQGQKAAVGKMGRLRIGFGFHTFEIVPRLIVRFRRGAPDVQVTLRDMSSAEQVAALESSQLDLGFARLPLPRGLETLPVVEDRLVLVSSAQHFPSKSISLEDCRMEPFVTISKARSPGFYQHMILLCAKHGFHPRIVQEVTEFTTALALVRSGLGLTIMPQSFWTSRFAGIRLHPLPEKAAAWSVGAAWRRGDANPALHRFIDLVRASSMNAEKR